MLAVYLTTGLIGSQTVSASVNPVLIVTVGSLMSR